ncbi:DNA internalization-related competence protein ComEC/Rec2 [soil metagenome]
MREIAASFFAGAALLNLLPELPHAVVPAALAIPALLVFRKPRAGCLLLAAATGFAWAWSHAAWRLADRLDPALEGQDLTLRGAVVSLPAPTRGIRFDFAPSPRASGVPKRLRLTSYDADVRPGAGERWQLVVRLRAPRGFMNPGGLDYEALLFREGIGASGYVRASPANRRLDRRGARAAVLELRRRIVEAMSAALGERPALGVLCGLGVGARERVTPEQWAVFARTGTSHLMAISGLHIGLVAALALFAIRRLWRLLPGLARRVAAADAGAIAALCAAGAYAMLAGFTIPTRRALIMLAVVLGMSLLRRRFRPAQHWCTALLLVLVLDPLAPAAPGFWLSFAAVAVIASSIAGSSSSRTTRWTQYGRVQWILFVGLAPFTLWIFGRAPLVAPLVNLVLIPLFSLVVIPLTLIGIALLMIAPPLAQTAWQVAAWLFETSWPVMQWAAALEWPFAGHPPLSALMTALPALLWIVASGALPGLPAAYAAMLPLVLARPAAPSPEDFRLTVLDVGQGLAAVVRTHRHVLVYDAGPAFFSGSDTGTLVVLPYLASQGIHRIDALVISHGDTDHAGGARAVLDALSPPRLFAGKPVAARIGRRATPCRTGLRWRWDGVAFEILHPPGDGRFAGNDASCVLRVSGAGGSALLPGDIERPAEAALAAGDIDADIVVVPHHGSATSSSTALIEATHSAYAVVSAGYRNRWGFPKPEISRRWARAGATVLDTASSGAITFEVGAAGGVGQPRLHRHEARRYWTAR